MPGYANPQALNRYSYVLGNPLKYTDPTGHGACQTKEDCEDMGTTPMGTGGSNNTLAPNDEDADDGDDRDHCSTAFTFEDCTISTVEFTVDELIQVQNTLYWLQWAEGVMGAMAGIPTLPAGLVYISWAGWEIIDLEGFSDYLDDAIGVAALQADQTITIEQYITEETGPLVYYYGYEGAPTSYGVSAPLANIIANVVMIIGALTP